MDIYPAAVDLSRYTEFTMPSPVRKRTLGFHANRLKWLGYAFALFLAINLASMLYEIPHTSAETKSTTSTAKAVDPDTAYARRAMFFPDFTQQVAPTTAVSEVNISEQTRHTVEDVQQRELRSEEIETVSSPPRGSQPLHWLSPWADRFSAWQAGAYKDDTIRPDDQDHDSIVPEIETDLPEIATEPPSSISHLTDPVATSRKQLGLLVRNPAANRASVAFLANGFQVALEPGDRICLARAGDGSVQLETSPA